MGYEGMTLIIYLDAYTWDVRECSTDQDFYSTCGWMSHTVKYTTYIIVGAHIISTCSILEKSS